MKGMPPAARGELLSPDPTFWGMTCDKVGEQKQRNRYFFLKIVKKRFTKSFLTRRRHSSSAHLELYVRTPS